jgi:hypothetical protein
MTEPKSIREIIKANYLQPAFLICAVVLTITAGALPPVAKQLGISLKKEPLPLKAPLSTLDKFPLASYTVAAKQTIDNPDVLETLGTEDYIQWVLEDTSVPKTDRTRFCSLFITYYPLADNVPHSPEECYVGGGFERASSEEVTLKIGSAGELASNNQRQIKARYLVFAKTNPDLMAGEATVPVLYIFSVNGEYYGGRNQARNILKIEYWKGVWSWLFSKKDQTQNIQDKKLRGKFSYFSKVEWKFYGNNFGRMTYPDKQEAVAASEKLMKVVLPVLEQQCWPSGLW